MKKKLKVFLGMILLLILSFYEFCFADVIYTPGEKARNFIFSNPILIIIGIVVIVLVIVAIVILTKRTSKGKNSTTNTSDNDESNTNN